MSETMGFDIPVIPLELPSYQRKENFGCDETFYRIVRALAQPQARTARIHLQHPRRHRAGRFATATTSVRSRASSPTMGIEVNVCAPLDATPCRHRPPACRPFQRPALPRDSGGRRALAGEGTTGSPSPGRSPSASAPPRDFIAEVQKITGLEDPPRRNPPQDALVVGLGRFDLPHRQARSFSSATEPTSWPWPASPATRWVSEVVGMGCYNREQARALRKCAEGFGVEALITGRLPRGGGGDRAASRPR